MDPEKDSLLLIFTRNPELGKCKTRLAAKIGDKTALEVYEFLLRHTVSFTRDLNVKKQVFYSETVWENDIWENSIYQKNLQEGADLGLKMLHAFKEGFEAGFKKIIIIGSDMFDLSRGDLETAFAKLDQYNYVIGPAEDGGYYLLGMTALEQKLFLDKSWGQNTVLGDTLLDLKNEEFLLLPEKNDIDHYEDIKHLEAFKPFIKHIKE